jgi:hypothetical protein
MGRQDELVNDLQELSDPAFFAYWAELRQRYAVTPKSSPEHETGKRDYSAVLAEYRRRIGGGQGRTA